VFVAGVSNATPYKIASRPEIGSLLELRGKSVATTTPGATTSVVLGEVLRRLGMEPDRDVSIAYVRDSPGMVAAVVSNNSQAAILSSPFVEQILAEGGKILLDVRELNVPILGINITTTRGQIERDPELIRRFLRGYIEGIQLAREDAEIGMQSLMKATQNTDRAVAEASYAEYRDIWNPWPSEAGIQILLDAMEEPAARSAKPADAIDLRFLQELERSGWLAEHYRPN
jgi:ABC-type nitrate/sulfonate/bicarbonate transport system substrate-binding protein